MTELQPIHYDQLGFRVSGFMVEVAYVDLSWFTADCLVLYDEYIFCYIIAQEGGHKWSSKPLQNIIKVQSNASSTLEA